jgi:phage regulator Rha-like protein
MSTTSQKPATFALVENNGVQTCPSTAIARQCELAHHSVLKLIDTHLASIEQAFGTVAFEIRSADTAAGPRQQRVAFLSERQATFLITLLGNTDAVIRFKLAVSQAFFTLRDRRDKVAFIGSFLREIPEAWDGTFPESFFKAVCDCYGLDHVKDRTPGFLGGFINRYIYEPILENLGEVLKARYDEHCDDSDADDAGCRLHRFLREHCLGALERQITIIETLLGVSRTAADFQRHFDTRSGGPQQSVPEYQTRSRRRNAPKALPE